MIMNYGDFKTGYETAVENTIKGILNSDDMFIDILQKKIADTITKYFDINDDCYTYNLTRSKDAFSVGTMTIDDFEELTEDVSIELSQYIIEGLKK